MMKHSDNTDGQPAAGGAGAESTEQPISLAVNVGGIRMKNPVMVASGTFGYGREYADLVDLNGLGAIVVKGLAVFPWPGNPLPRLVEVESGILNAIGLQGPGIDAFLADYMPFLRGFDVPVLVNIWGRTVEEYEEAAARLDDAPGVAGVELNISCPNVKQGGLAFGSDERAAAEVIRRVRARTRLPMIPKLSPNISQIGKFARVAEENGADALSLINSIPSMVIDVESRRPVLSNGVGGLSGPAIRPIAVRMVWEAAKAVKIPLVAMGGISCGRDALEFLIAGATAVAVGTANFSQPDTAPRVVRELREYLVRHGMRSVGELTGSLRMERPS